QDVLDVTADVLRHRLVLSYDALADGVPADHIIKRIVQTVPLPQVAPRQNAGGFGPGTPGGPSVPPPVAPMVPDPYQPAPAQGSFPQGSYPQGPPTQGAFPPGQAQHGGHENGQHGPSGSNGYVQGPQSA
ncbi:MAG: MoxR family ATPase, partial [Actinomycetota bacterium]|nr:MoxR family ATPase [Actinomycetota bacterium]